MAALTEAYGASGTGAGLEVYNSSARLLFTSYSWRAQSRHEGIDLTSEGQVMHREYLSWIDWVLNGTVTLEVPWPPTVGYNTLWLVLMSHLHRVFLTSYKAELTEEPWARRVEYGCRSSGPASILPHNVKREVRQVIVFESDQSSWWPFYHDWCVDREWDEKAQEIRAWHDRVRAEYERQGIKERTA